MILRMVEYDFMIALSGSRQQKDKKKMIFSRSCIIYLRSTKNTLTEEVLEMELPDGQEISYRVPVLKLKDYSIDEIFEKNLLILLPYYIMNYEKDFFKVAEDEEWAQKLVEEYRSVMKRLLKGCAKNSNRDKFIFGRGSILCGVTFCTIITSYAK